MQPPSFERRSFPTTVWTQIWLAQGQDRQNAQLAIGQVIENYWRSVAAFLQRKGLPPEEAEELTQDFFAHFLEKDIVRYVDRDRGRFRNFLLTAVSRYWAEKRRRVSYRMRPRVRLDAEADYPGHAPVEEETPDLVFARKWAEELVRLCLRRLQDECTETGRGVQFAIFRYRILEHPPRAAKELAAEFGISEMDVANYQRRVTSRFRRLLQEEVRNWVAEDADVESEVRSLLSLFTS
jgi:RNA polymerase sigma-70 factor (ECF subfamily)